MNRAESTRFVWALADAAKPLHSSVSQAWLCTKIGAGDQEEAIVELLRFLADNGCVLAAELTTPLMDWMSGYAGSEGETELRVLANRIAPHSVPITPCSDPTPVADPWQGRGRRVRTDTRTAVGPSAPGSTRGPLRHPLDQGSKRASAAVPTIA